MILQDTGTTVLNVCNVEPYCSPKNTDWLNFGVW